MLNIDFKTSVGVQPIPHTLFCFSLHFTAFSLLQALRQFSSAGNELRVVLSNLL